MTFDEYQKAFRRPAPAQVAKGRPDRRSRSVSRLDAAAEVPSKPETRSPFGEASKKTLEKQAVRVFDNKTATESAWNLGAPPAVFHARLVREIEARSRAERH